MANTAAEIEQLELELRKVQLEADLNDVRMRHSYVAEAEYWVGEAAKLRDPDEADWVQIGADFAIRKEGRLATYDELSEIRDQCRTLGQERPTGRGLVRTFQKYVVGASGLTVQFGNLPEGAEDVVKDRWKKWRRKHGWRQHQLEVVKRLVKDGESVVNLQVLDGELAPRFLNPDYLRDPQNRYSWGIETHPRDVTEHIRYYYHTPAMRSPDEVDVFDADEINFFKIETDSDVKRGLPLLYSLRKPINQYDTWLEYRMALNKARAAIVLLRKHTGTPGQVENFRRSRKTDTKKDAQGTEINRERIYPGTKMDVPAGVEYEYKSPDVQAQDVRHDGRAVLLQVAAGASVAEFMISADASNATYSSTMVSESPAVKEFELWRGDVEDHVRPTVQKWLDVEADKGRIPDAAAEDAEISFQGPRLTTRDPLEHAKANQILRQEGVKSIETWREELDLDTDKEDERFARVQEEELYG